MVLDSPVSHFMYRKIWVPLKSYSEAILSCSELDIYFLLSGCHCFMQYKLWLLSLGLTLAQLVQALSVALGTQS